MKMADNKTYCDRGAVTPERIQGLKESIHDLESTVRLQKSFVGHPHLVMIDDDVLERNLDMLRLEIIAKRKELEDLVHVPGTVTQRGFASTFVETPYAEWEKYVEDLMREKGVA
jgi:hypothetical protein